MKRDGTSPIRVMLVDDHPVIREGLAAVLACEEISVCAQAEGRQQALGELSQAAPQLAVVDLSLGMENGLELVADLDERGIPVLVYSMHEDGEHVRRALDAGARGYVTKREMHRVLIEAIREIAAGREYLGPRAAASLASRLTRAGKRSHADLEALSEREREVYRLLGEGSTISEIATALHISTRTAESYCARMMEKLGLGGMRPLRRDAIQHGHEAAE